MRPVKGEVNHTLITTFGGSQAVFLLRAWQPRLPGSQQKHTRAAAGGEEAGTSGVTKKQKIARLLLACPALSEKGASPDQRKHRANYTSHLLKLIPQQLVHQG